MEFSEASRLGTIADIISGIHIFTLLITIVSPIILLLLIIYIIKYFHKRHKIKKEKKKAEAKKKQEEKKKKEHIDRLYNNDKFMMKQLDNLDEPFDKSTYRSLDMTFDKDGKATGSK